MERIYDKIYSLKYSAATGGLIAVSELAKEFLVNKPKLSNNVVSGCCRYSNAANIDISNVWARDYLDLAQIKYFQPVQQT